MCFSPGLVTRTDGVRVLDLNDAKSPRKVTSRLFASNSNGRPVWTAGFAIAQSDQFAEALKFQQESNIRLVLWAVSGLLCGQQVES